ncbi:MAG: hypothetical protein E4H13_10670 [Calditrichales bacterium]|nr:MAG: hypothetical protein E4H13_10670 [Calditrichales bacterium]
MKNNDLEFQPAERSERRFNSRYKSADFYTYFRPLKKWNLLNRFRGPCLVDDISITSIRFDSVYPINEGSALELKVASVSKLSTLKIKGTIFRIEKSVTPGSKLYVVQFNPYGSRSFYNAIQVKKQLEKYISEFLHEKD